MFSSKSWIFDFERGEIFPDFGDDIFVVFPAVDHDPVNFFGEEIAHGAAYQIGFYIDAGGFLCFFQTLGDGIPALEEDMKVANEVAGFFAFSGCADDDAHAFGKSEFAQNAF